MANRFIVTSPTFTRGRNTLNERRGGSTYIKNYKYFGQFAIDLTEDSADGKRQFIVVDNTYPNKTTAGQVDLLLPEWHIPSKVFPFAECTVYLVAIWNGEEYRVEIINESPKYPNEEFGYIEIGRISSGGSIVQSYRGGGPIYFSGRYFV